jgi:hypothetical protein
MCDPSAYGEAHDHIGEKLMCLTVDAFALFLTLISPERITTVPDHITIHAEVEDVRWIRSGENWCIAAETATRIR